MTIADEWISKLTEQDVKKAVENARLVKDMMALEVLNYDPRIIEQARSEGRDPIEFANSVIEFSIRLWARAIELGDAKE